MFIRIDTSSGVPLWQQIVAQVARQAASGAARAGERLATVRELAADLRINPNTAARAYQELEKRGIVETRRGQGTFVCGRESWTTRGEGVADLSEQIDALLVETMQRRIPVAELLSAIEARSRTMDDARAPAAIAAAFTADGDPR